MRFMIHRKLTASGADLAAEKAANNRGRGSGRPSPQEGLVGEVKASGKADGERGG